MKKILMTGLSAALMASSFAASAANFDFGGHDWNWKKHVVNHQTTAFDDNSLSVSITSNQHLGAFNDDGIGAITTGHGTGQLWHRALQTGEQLTLKFNKKVDIGTIHLRQWELADTANLRVQADNNTIDLSGDSDWWDTNEYFNVNLKNVSTLTIGSTGHLSAFFLKGLCDVTPAAVPVPAAAWLLATGLAGLGAVKRRKKSA